MSTPPNRSHDEAAAPAEALGDVWDLLDALPPATASRTPSSQLGSRRASADSSFAVLKRELAGRRAAVGYSAVVSRRTAPAGARIGSPACRASARRNSA